jgi:hypothetical protein
MVKSESVPVNTPIVQSLLKMTIIDVRDVTWFSKHFNVAKRSYFMHYCITDPRMKV